MKKKTMTNEAAEDQKKVTMMEGFHSLFEMLIAIGIIIFTISSFIGSYTKWGWFGLVMNSGIIAIIGMLGAKITRVDRCEDDG